MLHKKSLGQHFLRSKGALDSIVAAANLTSSDVVLEVGPGEGVLTELLLQKAGKVIAVEKDDRLIPVLQQKFSAEISSGKFELIHGDILFFSPTNYSLLTTNYKVVANIPYYITGALLRKFLEADRQPSTMVLLLQKEVARRIVATDGKESILSISIKAYGVPRYVGTVKAGSFSPPPTIDSAIIAIENISKDFFMEGASHSSSFNEGGPATENERRFFQLLKKGFAHPRKLLASNLGFLPEKLEACGIAPKARAEELDVSNWKSLTELGG